MTHPSDFHSDLSRDRLEIVAAIAKSALDAVVASKDSRSDEWWGIACHRYHRMRNEFEKATTQHKWLTFVPEQGLGFTLKVGAVPIRVQAESDFAKPVLAAERLALEGFQTTLGFAASDVPESFLRLEYYGPRMKPIARIVLKRCEASDVTVDCWSLFPWPADESEFAGADILSPATPPHQAPPAHFELSGDESEQGAEPDEKTG